FKVGDHMIGVSRTIIFISDRNQRLLVLMIESCIIELNTGIAPHCLKFPNGYLLCNWWPTTAIGQGDQDNQRQCAISEHRGSSLRFRSIGEARGTVEGVSDQLGFPRSTI